MIPFNVLNPQSISNVNGYARYFAHMDEDDSKYHYDPELIVAHNGADIESLLTIPNQTGKYLMIQDMMDFVSQNEVTEIKDLFDYAGLMHQKDWFPLLVDG